MVKFLNATAHNFADEQKERIAQMFSAVEIVNLADENPELYKRFLKSPVELEAISKLAVDLIKFIDEGGYHYVHLPIGSPAVMFYFARNYAELCSCQFVFSHSERQSVECYIDGKTIKRNVFRFKDFIIF